MKKIPQRMCVVTKEKTDKRNLLRIVKTKDNQILVDLTGKQNGKGAYITKSKEAKALDKALEITIPDSIYDEIESII